MFESSCHVAKAFKTLIWISLGHGLRTTNHDHMKTQILYSSQPLVMSVKQPLHMMVQPEC